MVSSSEPLTSPRQSSLRRRALLTTAWAAPVAIATTAAPALAASPPECPTIQVERGAWMQLGFNSVDERGRWQKGKSSATIRLSVGDAKDYDWGALAFMSDQNDVYVTARTYVYTLTWEIDMNFTQVPAHWYVTKVTSGSDYTYTISYVGPAITKEASTPLGVEPDGHSPLVFIPPTEFGIEVIQNQFADGETVSDGRREYPYHTHFRVEYDVDVPGARCDLYNQVYTRENSLSLRPD